MKFFIFYFSLFFLIFSCASKEEKNSPELLYKSALKLLKSKNYIDSAKEFEKIDDDFPFSKWAIKGQVMASYAYYKNKDFEKVIQIGEDFSRLNPTSEYLPYMLYLRGICYYLQIPTIDRAQDYSSQASAIFRELIVRFPQDDHALDAKEKLIFVDEHLAGAIIEQARRQIKNQNFIGAINNLQLVISRYRFTNQVAESYFRLAEIYWYLGNKKEFYKAKKILSNQFSDSYWFKQLLTKFS
jgi:outer membrane protein assembly factor BamD